jgi:LexA-binding, inner membrane-associated putative hydrolase
VITGHLGIAAAANATRRDSTLLWLLGASMAPDVVDALFVVARSCNPHGLYSHTLPAAALIAAVTGGAAFLVTGQRATGLLAMLLVLAHVPLDFITGHKLFWPGDELRGLRLYDWPVLDFLLEGALTTLGWWLLRKRAWAPRWAVTRGALAALLVLQASTDVVGSIRSGLKPSSCARVAPLE